MYTYIKYAHFFIVRVCFIFLLTGCCNALNAQDWVKQIGGSQPETGVNTVADMFGNVYTIGTFSGTSTFGSFISTSSGKGDVFVCRSNASTGTVDWVKQLGGIEEDNGLAIASDAFGNIYCAGRFSGIANFGNYTLTANGGSEAFLIKLDPINGNVSWARRMGGSGNDGALAITSDVSGNIYTTGYFQGTATFGTVAINPIGTNFNIFLSCTDGASGNTVWAKRYGSSGYSFGSALSCDDAGAIYLTGYFEGDVTFGATTVSAVQYQDVFVSKHDLITGNPVWAFSEGGAGNDNGTGIISSADGFIYSIGRFEETCAFGTTTLSSAGSADIFICKRDAANGTRIWVKRFGAEGYEQPNAIASDATGNFFITGQFNGFVDFGNTLLASNGSADAFIAQINPAGNVLWVTAMGGINTDSGYGISSGLNNALYCTGTFQSNASFANFNLSSNGGTDVFVVKLNSTTVGIEETHAFFDFTIKPIPCFGPLALSIGSNGLSYQLSVTALTGNVVLELQGNEPEQQLNLHALSPGVYFLTVRMSNGKTAVKKIIKQ